MIGYVLGKVRDLTVPPSEFFQTLRAHLTGGARILTFYASPSTAAADVELTAVLESSHQLHGLRTKVEREKGFHSLTRDFPALHIFEREIFEQHGVKPHDHPWLKPVRFPGAAMGQMDTYPFFRIEGKEVHEVAVGPVHAGVIEPGHFRFMCLGETVHHLEIQLGYQHRAVEALLLRRAPRALAPLVETIAGDTSIAHTWAYCAALEALAGTELALVASTSRAIGLELERVAMHLAGLAGMATDIAFLQGGSTYGRLRTTAINTSMLLCGSRFGRGWLRPGGARASMPSTMAADVRSNLALIKKDIGIINEHFLAARTVRHRLQGVGALSKAQAQELGLVGMAARACGVGIDVRASLPARPYSQQSIPTVVEQSGDCWARARIRIREIDASLDWMDATVQRVEKLEPSEGGVGPLAPETLAVGVCEGWRGETVHCLETDSAGALRHYKVQDPSLRNWFGLALALRDNEISDFPICNKSFDLSYCGNDL
jgi:Ni,Fe-hydrogenase III large subunit